MATFRKVDTRFWQDEYILTLNAEQKYFYLYLITNTKTTQIGIYTLPMAVIQFETGLKQENINKLIQKFKDDNKIEYKNGEVFIKSWSKWNWTSSPKILSRLLEDFKEIKDTFKEDILRVMIQYGYSIDTVSLGYGYILEEKRIEKKRKEEEIEEEENKKKKNNENHEKNEVKEIIDYLNNKIDSNYKHTTNKTIKVIKARYNEGFKFVDFKNAIDNAYKHWSKTNDFSNMKPTTLFNGSFESRVTGDAYSWDKPKKDSRAWGNENKEHWEVIDAGGKVERESNEDSKIAKILRGEI